MMHACTEWHTPLPSASSFAFLPCWFFVALPSVERWYQSKIIDFYSSIRDFLRGPATSMFHQTSFQVKKPLRNVFCFRVFRNLWTIFQYQTTSQLGVPFPTGTFFYSSSCCSISSPSVSVQWHDDDGVTAVTVTVQWLCSDCDSDCEWKNPMNVLQRQFLHRCSGWGRCFFFDWVHIMRTGAKHFLVMQPTILALFSRPSCFSLKRAVNFCDYPQEKRRNSWKRSSVSLCIHLILPQHKNHEN